jgi:formate-dependent nitrite reductase membrane component NrfD
VTNPLDSYRDPEGPRRRRGSGGKDGKSRRATDWLNDRREGRGERALVPDVEFESYYGRAVVKPVPWEAPIPIYLFTGGLAAGSQVLATGAYLTGNEQLMRVTRLTSGVATAVSGAALVADLGRPERFYNMLRVAKLSSPMSVGTWIFSAFSAGAVPLAGREALRLVLGEGRSTASAIRRRGGVIGLAERFLGAIEAPSAGLAAIAATPLATYTAVLLSNTATPTWAESRHHLPFVFAGSASAAASGNAMMWVPVASAGPARALALIGSIVDVAAMHQLEQHLDAHGVGEPLHHGTPGRLNKASVALNVAGFLGTALFARRSRVASVASGACFVAGSVCTRFAIFEAGMESAKDPKYTMAPQRRRLDDRGGTGNITTGPTPSDAPMTSDGRRPLPGPDGRPTNI